MTTYLVDEFADAGAVEGRSPDEGTGAWTGIGGVAVSGGALVNSAAGGTNSALIDLGATVAPIELQADVYLPERSGSNINEMVEFYLYETTPTSPYSEYKVYLTAFDSFVQWTFYGSDGGDNESLQYDWFPTAIPAGSTVALSVVLDGAEIRLSLDGDLVHSWAPSGGMQLFDAAVRLAVRFQAQFVTSAMAVNRVGVATYGPAPAPTRNVLLKTTNVTTIPGTPGNDGVPPTPATPARSYTVTEVVCQMRLVPTTSGGGSYEWVTPAPTFDNPNPQPQYVFVGGGATVSYQQVYSCEETAKTVFEPGTPGTPGIPPTPPSPAVTSYEYNLGWNSGARSVGFFNADGYVEFVPVVATGIVAGLNDSDQSPGYFEIEHAWYFSGGIARIYENGVMVHYAGAFAIDADVFKIERRGPVVRYFKNGAPVYTSAKPSYGPAFLDASMYSGGDMLADAVIGALGVTSEGGSSGGGSGSGGLPPVEGGRSVIPLGAFTPGSGGDADASYTITINTSGGLPLVITVEGTTASAADVAAAFEDAGFGADGSGSVNGFTLDLGGEATIEDAITEGTLTIVREDGVEMWGSEDTTSAAEPAYTTPPNFSGLSDSADAPTFSEGGDSGVEATGTGIRIPMMQVLGYEDAYATATLTVPMPTISAGMLSKATLTIPMPQLLASNRSYGAATLRVPMPTMTANGGFPVPAYALATLIVPRLSLVGFGLTGEIGGATLTVPMMDMLASEGSYGEATMTLPMPRMVASAYEGNGQAFMYEFMAPSGTLQPQLVTALVMNEDMTVAAVMGLEFVANVAMAESLTVDDSLSAAALQLASMFSVVRVGSGVPVVNAIGGAAGPGGVPGNDPYHPDVRLNSDVQVWAMDWETSATTSYENYAFNSFAVLDGKAYGAKADGIYLLEGDDDEGVPIRASVNFGANDFGTTKHKAMPHAYVGVAASGQLYLRVQVDGGQSYFYEARRVDAAQQVQRFDFGKGLKGSYYTFELFNRAGADFDLDKIEFMPVALSRRI